MGLKSLAGQIWQDKATVVYRPPQVYDAAVGGGIYNLFTITGPVLITLLGGRVTAAPGGATQIRLTVNLVNVDAAAVAINGAVGTVFLSTLNVAGTLVNAAAIPMTDALLHPKGFVATIQPAAVGLIIGTFTVNTWTGDIFCVYRKLAPASRILVA